MMAAVSVPFAPSTPFTIGVELELQLLDWRTYNLVPAAPRLLTAIGPPTARIKPEIFRSMIEINTGICRDVGAVRADLSRSLDEVRAAADSLGIEIASSGTHPFATHTGHLFYPSDRYRQLLERNAWIARRLLIFGLHIHLGMRNGDHAIATMNVLARHLGHLLALSASSPFWEGEDTGLASARITIFESVPTAGTPPSFRTWAEFVSFYDKMISSRSVGSLKDFWWDVRPSPGYGTLEIRICDCPSTLDETLAIVALAQCLAAAADEHLRHRLSPEPPPSWLLRENKWRAARHGLDAEVLVDDRARARPLREELAGLVRTLEPVAQRLGCATELAAVHGIVARGTGATRQRAVFARTSSLLAVTEALVEELRTNEPVAVA